MRLRQVLWRGRRLVPPALLAVGTNLPGPPAWEPVAVELGVDRAPQSGPLPPPHESGAFAAIGACRTVGRSDFWTDLSDGLLFLFELHGFSQLAAYVAGRRTSAGNAFWAQVVGDWLARHGRPQHPGWHPFPTSLRLIAWSAALSTISEWPQSLRRAVAQAIAEQARYLRRTIEHDIGGNHVLKNATALVFAGAVVPAAGVLDTGIELLRRETRRQFLADGGHEERSTSYHRAVTDHLRDVAELLRRCGREVPEWLAAATRDAAAWEQALAGPDGRLPLLNDAWEGPPLVSHALSRALDLAESGYVVFRHDRDQAVFDAGPVSPPHLPPHAHADVLSFVLWADGHPLIVDPGAYSYTGPWRKVFRSTAAHNTVEVDGRDQCELWGDFRVAYPPSVHAHSVREAPGVSVAVAAHDGYRRLSDPVTHHRALVWLHGRGVIVVDRLSAHKAHRVRSRLHLAPGTSAGPGQVGPFRAVALGTGSRVARIEGLYAPFLGKRVPISVLEDSRTVEPGGLFGWSLLRDGFAIARLTPESIEITEDGGPCLSVPLGRW